jgi:hypothetical protein
LKRQCQFETKFNGETSSRFHIQSGVHEGSILGPLLYVLFTSDLPTFRGTRLGTFADDSAIFATHEDTTIASLNLQEHIFSNEKWLQKQKIKVNESQSSHITFTLRNGHCPAVNINQTIKPQAETVKHLGLQFDLRLTWKDHIAKKRKQMNLQIKEINWLIERKSYLCIENKVLIYKAIIKPIWGLLKRTVGLRQQIPHRHHEENPIQNSQSHSKFSLVCYKSYTPLRPQSTIRK